MYTQRILQSLGAQRTAPTMSDEDLAALESLRKAMTEDAERGDLEAWDDAHKRFHFALVAGAGPHLLQVIGSLMDRAEHYRTMYQESGPRAWANAGVEHKAIVEAFELQLTSPALRCRWWPSCRPTTTLVRCVMRWPA